MLLAMLSYDAHVASLFGKDPETIFELILMLRDARLPCLSCIYRNLSGHLLFFHSLKQRVGRTKDVAYSDILLVPHSATLFHGNLR